MKGDLKMNTKAVKIIGIVATVGGAVANVVASAVSKKEQDAKIAEEVSKAVAEALGNKEN